MSSFNKFSIFKIFKNSSTEFIYTLIILVTLGTLFLTYIFYTNYLASNHQSISTSTAPIFTPIPSSTTNFAPSNKPIIFHSPEPISQWKTYTNSKYGYSIKHPSYWSVDNENENLIYLNENRQDDGSFFSQTINIGVYPGKGNLSFMQFLKDIFYANNNPHDTSMVDNQLDNTNDLTDQWLSGLVSTSVAIGSNKMETIGWVPNLAGSYGDGYWATHNNNGYFILFSIPLGEADKTKEPEQVLSTFKFIN